MAKKNPAQENSQNIELLEQFIDNLSIEKGLTKNTLSSYTADIKDFAMFLQKKKPIRLLKNVIFSDILEYITVLSKNNFNAKTQSRRISAIKQFYKFCYSEQIINNNPSLDIKNPKISKTLPKFLSIQQVEKMLNYSKGKNYQFYVMLEILYSTGLRISELVSLKTYNIVEDGNFLLVNGKGNKERLVPLTKLAKLQLTNWLLEKQKIKIIPNNHYLFPSTISNSGHITRERFAQILKQIATECNINANLVSPHIIRHSFASHILNNGGDIKHIQSLLGHSDISTTEIYTHIMDNKLVEAVYKHHPLANIKFNK